MTRVPWITLLLIAANLIPAFGLLFDPEIAYSFGFRPDAPTALTALTSLFLHLNVIHLLGNMVFLAAVGPSVEFAVGAVKFLVIYLVGGLLGALVHWLMYRNVVEPNLLIGASGSIAACVGYASVRYFATPVHLAPKLKLPIWSVGALWVALQVVGGFVRLGDPGGSAAFWDHLGGFVAGVLLSLIFKAPASVAVEVGHQKLSEMSERSPAAMLAAAEQHLKRHPEDLKALAQKADAHASLGDHQQEAETRLRIVDLSRGMPLAMAIHQLAKCDPSRFAALPALRRIRDAETLRTLDPEASATLLESIKDGPIDEPQRPDAMLALADLLREAEPERAHDTLVQLGQDYPLHPAVDLARAKGLLK
ncbi:MAG: rhomboid family intramembrane serine protease [Fimbriimonadaceae bacterium]|nr:rhomboid family intramembrane serine protease [Fimbriimonadaceae bacterium]